MPRETGLSVNAREFIRRALSEHQRLDGRNLDTYRDLKITFGQEPGVADVRLGKTRYVLCTLAKCNKDGLKLT